MPFGDRTVRSAAGSVLERRATGGSLKALVARPGAGSSPIRRLCQATGSPEQASSGFGLTSSSQRRCRLVGGGCAGGSAGDVAGGAGRLRASVMGVGKASAALSAAVGGGRWAAACVPRGRRQGLAPGPFGVIFSNTRGMAVRQSLHRSLGAAVRAAGLPAGIRRAAAAVLRST